MGMDFRVTCWRQAVRTLTATDRATSPAGLAQAAAEYRALAAAEGDTLAGQVYAQQAARLENLVAVPGSREEGR